LTLPGVRNSVAMSDFRSQKGKNHAKYVHRGAFERDIASQDNVVKGHSMHNATAYYWKNEGAK